MIARGLASVAAMVLLGAATRDDPLAGRVAGKPVTCITLSSTTGPEVVDERTILYRDGRRIWKTGPRGACPSLRPLQTIITTVYGGQLCRNDRFQLLAPQTTIPSAACFFDTFTPYERRR